MLIGKSTKLQKYRKYINFSILITYKACGCVLTNKLLTPADLIKNMHTPVMEHSLFLSTGISLSKLRVSYLVNITQSTKNSSRFSEIKLWPIILFPSVCLILFQCYGCLPILHPKNLHISLLALTRNGITQLYTHFLTNLWRFEHRNEALFSKLPQNVSVGI